MRPVVDASRPSTAAATATIDGGGLTDGPATTIDDDNYVLYMNILGLTRNKWRADACGVHVCTVARARAGNPVGERFILATLGLINKPANRALLTKLGLKTDLVGCGIFRGPLVATHDQSAVQPEQLRSRAA